MSGELDAQWFAKSLHSLDVDVFFVRSTEAGIDEGVNLSYDNVHSHIFEFVLGLELGHHLGPWHISFTPSHA